MQVAYRIQKREDFKCKDVGDVDDAGGNIEPTQRRLHEVRVRQFLFIWL